jgi:ATP-dependent RNA helicase DDX19/DBP5
MIGQSQSGTGKTAAFVLTMLSRVDVSQNCPQAICVCPSRELARQIMDVAEQMGQYVTGLTKRLASKDTLERGEKITEHIIVGTPGTIKDVCSFLFLQKKSFVKVMGGLLVGFNFSSNFWNSRVSNRS